MGSSKPYRPDPRPMLLGCAAFAAVVMLHPSPASADIAIPLDPTSSFLKLGNAWFATLQGFAVDLYYWLFGIELIIVGYHAVLFKDNIAEFFQTFVWKFAQAFAMLMVIANAGTIFPGIVSMFQRTAIFAINHSAANSTTNADGTTNAPTGVALGNSCGYDGTDPSVNGANLAANCTVGNPALLEGAFFLLAAPYFAAADAAKDGDSAEGTSSGVEFVGNGDPGLAEAFTHGHDLFETFCLFMGMTLVTAGMSVYFTYLLLTFEVQIVMSIGVVFLAFQGSRFTAQFSQGYMSYAINIGTKFFVFYFVLAIMTDAFVNNPALGVSAVATLAAAAASPFGTGSIVIAAATLPICLMAVVTAGLIAAVPNFAGSLLSGSSALSASAAMGQLTSAIGSASAMQHSRAEARHEKAKAHQKQDRYERMHSSSPPPLAARPDTDTGTKPNPYAATPSPSANGGGGGASEPAETPVAGGAGSDDAAAGGGAGAPSATGAGAVADGEESQTGEATRAPGAPTAPRTASNGAAQRPQPPSAVSSGPPAGSGAGARHYAASEHSPRDKATQHMRPGNAAVPPPQDVAAPSAEFGSVAPGQPQQNLQEETNRQLQQLQAKLDVMRADAQKHDAQADQQERDQIADTVDAAAQADRAAQMSPFANLAGFAPKGEQAGAPVQIRVTNSDKAS